MAIDTKEIKSRVRARHGAAITVVSEFVGWRTRMTFKCRSCKHVWKTMPQNICSGTGCPKCAKQKRGQSISRAHRTNSQKAIRYTKVLANVGRKLGIEHVGPLPETRLSVIEFRCLTCKHTWNTGFNVIREAKVGCPECAQKVRLAALERSRSTPRPNQFTTEEYSRYVYAYTRGAVKLKGEWSGARNDRELECTVCGHTWVVKGGGGRDVKTGLTCPCCRKSRNYSEIALRWLEGEAKKRRIKIQHALNGGEVKIPGTKFKADGYNARLRLVFEFYGDAYHGNPARYAPRTRPHPYSNRTARSLYNETMARQKAIEELGYTVISIWEADYRAQQARG